VLGISSNGSPEISEPRSWESIRLRPPRKKKWLLLAVVKIN